MVAIYQDSTFRAMLRASGKEGVLASMARERIAGKAKAMRIPREVADKLTSMLYSVHAELDQLPYCYEERLGVRLHFRFPDGHTVAFERRRYLASSLCTSRSAEQARWDAVQQALRLDDVEILQLASAL